MERCHGRDWPDKPVSCHWQLFHWRTADAWLTISSVQNDCISWILDANRQLGLDCQRGSIEDMALRVLHINFAAVHTTSVGQKLPWAKLKSSDRFLLPSFLQMALTHALFHLAANPHLMDPLREEVATVVKQGGWRKESLANMRLLEGFLKESHRRVGAGASEF